MTDNCIKDDGCDNHCEGCPNGHDYVSAKESLERLYARPDFIEWLERVRKNAIARNERNKAAAYVPFEARPGPLDNEHRLTVGDVL